MITNNIGIKELSKRNSQTISGGNPVVIFAAGLAGIYSVVKDTIRSKGYSDGKKSANCN